LHDGLPALGGGDGIVVGHSGPPARGDLVDNGLSGIGRSPVAVDGATDVVDDDAGSATRQF
jgi:hypothetical protein